MAVQPVDMHSNMGVICTIGVMSKNDRTAIVFPMATDSSNLDRASLCDDALETLQSIAVPLLQAVMSVDAHVTHIQVEGMMDGSVPARQDYAAGLYPGTRTGTTIANNVCGLGALYCDPTDTPAGDVMPVAKTFFPGLSTSDVTNDLVATAVRTAIEAFLQALQEGMVSAGSGDGKWWRVLKKASQTAFSELLKRTINWVSRHYVGTQRRRLVPHN